VAFRRTPLWRWSVVTAVPPKFVTAKGLSMCNARGFSAASSQPRSEYSCTSKDILEQRLGRKCRPAPTPTSLPRAHKFRSPLQVQDCRHRQQEDAEHAQSNVTSHPDSKKQPSARLSRSSGRGAEACGSPDRATRLSPPLEMQSNACRSKTQPPSLKG